MTTTTASAVRVQTVDNYVTKDPAFAAKLGPRDVIVKRRDNAELLFSKEIVAITEALVKAGEEPVRAGKAKILQAAQDYFNGIATAEAVESEQPHTPTPGDLTPNWNVAIWSLLMSALELCKRDRKPGAPARSAKLQELVKDYQVTT